MTYTPNLKAAIRFAIKTHDVYQKQIRKGNNVAYITHPLTVGLILSQAKAPEEVVIAGILHDTIEDSVPEKKVTKKMLRERFGSKVADLVDSVTEHRKKDPWAKRKREALAHIATFNHGSVLVKSADVLSNGRDLLDEYALKGEKIFLYFHAPKEEKLDHNLKVIDALLKKWPGSPLAGDLRDLKKGMGGLVD